ASADRDTHVAATCRVNLEAISGKGDVDDLSLKILVNVDRPPPHEDNSMATLVSSALCVV
ncbi:hypothetical protein JG687_00018667, partial [Phytophthora cactorum]